MPKKWRNIFADCRTARALLESEGALHLWAGGDRARFSAPLNKPLILAIIHALILFFGSLAIDLTRARKPQNHGNSEQDASVTDVLVYVGGINEMAAICPTIEAKSDLKFTLVTSNPEVFRSNDTSIRHVYAERAAASLSAIIFIATNANFLYQIATREARGALWAFRLIIRNIMMANELLRRYAPKILLVSNDHSAAQRCLIGVAHLTGVRTAYLQHASVSTLFPKLDFDYAFLDGEKALNIYAECSGSPQSAICRRPVVFLSGQKKAVAPHDLRRTREIGLAINNLDPAGNICSLLSRLCAAGHIVTLRPHPQHDASSLATILEHIETMGGGATLSNPQTEMARDYVARARVVVAGNSSILLEAALAGTPAIYYDMAGRIEYNDYYGYVRGGICLAAASTDDLLDLLGNNIPVASPAALRHYSETATTPWFGNEGYLVSKTLSLILREDDPGKLYSKTNDERHCFGSVYRLSAPTNG